MAVHCVHRGRVGDALVESERGGRSAVRRSLEGSGRLSASTFDTPMALMPSVRVNRQGQIDPHSSEADAKAGAFELEKRLFLFRNLEHIHWVPLIPSERDPATGAWRGGDLDGAGDGRGLGIAGNCIFVGHCEWRRRQARHQHPEDPGRPGEAAASGRR